MRSRETPRSVQQDISIQRIGTETLVYDERRHQAFCLNESSSVVWELANGERTIAEMCAAAALQLKAPVTEEFVLFAVEELRRDRLMEPAADAEVGRTISRRAVLQRLGAGGAMLLPVVAAMIAPTAAQAYSGCVDCSTVSPAVRAAQLRRQQQLLQKSTTTAVAPSDMPPE